LTPKQKAMALVDMTYFKTAQFFIKVATILMLFAGAISVSVVYSWWATSRYYNFVAVTGIVIAVIVILLNFFQFFRRFPRVPWHLIEMAYDLLWAILVLIAAAVCTDWARRFIDMDSYAAAAFFGYVAFLLYVLDIVIRYLAYRRAKKLFKQEQKLRERQHQQTVEQNIGYPMNQNLNNNNSTIY
jgi:hypothetical protein